MSQYWKMALAGACMAFASSLVQAADVQLGALHITHPYARPSLPGVPNAAAWLGVHNSGSVDDRIIGVKSDLAQRNEIHDMTLENDIMRMFPVSDIELPAGKTVVLGEGNKLHIMLLGLKNPLKEGDQFPLTIQFEKAGEVQVEVYVEPAKKSGAASFHKAGAHSRAANAQSNPAATNAHKDH